MKRETLLPPYAESLWLRHSTLIVILEAAILLLPFLGMALSIRKASHARR